MRQYRTLYEVGLDMCEMANLSKRNTDLPVNIWIQEETTTNYNLPRIKFQNNYGNNFDIRAWVPVSIEDEPKILVKNTKLNISGKDLDKVFEWIKLNKQGLLDHWYHKISTFDFFQIMKRYK